MTKPYHLMTSDEKIAARIAANRAIEQKVAEGQAPKTVVKDFARIGRAFLDRLPDMEKGKEAENLLELGKTTKPKK